jgi:hypothetical protein
MQQTCIINAWKERWSDFEEFGARIAEIGVRLQRYGEKNFRDLFVISGKWLGLNLEIFLDSRVPFGNSVDCGLILDKYRGFFAKWQGFSSWGFIL